VLAIAGTANLRSALREHLGNEKIRYFNYEENPMYTQRESQLIQQYIQEHGRLPEGVGKVDDLFNYTYMMLLIKGERRYGPSFDLPGATYA